MQIRNSVQQRDDHDRCMNSGRGGYLAIPQSGEAPNRDFHLPSSALVDVVFRRRIADTFTFDHAEDAIY